MADAIDNLINRRTEARKSRKADDERSKATVNAVLDTVEATFKAQIPKLAKGLEAEGVTLRSEMTLASGGSYLHFSVDRAKGTATILSDRPTRNFMERYVVNEQGVLARESNSIEPVKLTDEIAACVDRFLS